ncbi:MAG: DNA/RNA non-specific endonuclease [Bacteroidales bacterium]|nr:DNA/RNA non-specific endonuclease [Bacteroidales bacterium]
MKNTYFASIILCAAALTALTASCDLPVGEFAQSELLEIPAITADDIILDYKGYDDICHDKTKGEPSSVSSDPEKVAFTLSYDPVNRIPRWVAYELTKEETYGPYQRQGKAFRPDPRLSVAQAVDKDYRGSGWTRGHMAPAADFRWSDEAMDDTFHFTNCCPQSQVLNANGWDALEGRVRNWARVFGSVWVVTGPIVGERENGRIGLNQVTVPDAFFKAILAQKDGQWHAVAFVMHNNDIPQDYPNCAMSVDKLEGLTGIDFFCLLDEDDEAAAESEVDRGFWRF